jgi:hypothetical protein
LNIRITILTNKQTKSTYNFTECCCCRYIILIQLRINKKHINLPVPTGLSIYMTESDLLHEYFLLPSFCPEFTTKGPFSVNNPKRDVAPGPPWSHSTTGAVL